MQFTINTAEAGVEKKLGFILRGFIIGANSTQKSIADARTEDAVLEKLEAAGLSRENTDARGFPLATWRGSVSFGKPEYDVLCRHFRKAIEMPAFAALELREVLAALDWLESIKGQEPAST